MVSIILKFQILFFWVLFYYLLFVLFSDISGSIAETFLMIRSSVCLCGSGRTYKIKGC